MGLRSRRYGWYVLVLLAGLNLLNYATRNVVVTMYPDLREALSLSDTQLGWLSSAFLFGHAAMNVPFGWLADRYDRRRVLAIGGAIWSLANIGCAVADGFGALVASRALAGIGTASCVPVANALLCDVFPGERKSRAVAILNIGLFLGGGVGFVLGERVGFPLAFVALAAPGLAVVWMVALMDVPPLRSMSSPPLRPIEVFRELRILLAKRTMRRMVTGAVFASFAASGYLAWFADFLDRAKGFEPVEAMLTLGAIGLSGGLAGVLAGGLVADRAYHSRTYGRLMTVAIGLGAAVPCAIVSIYSDRGVIFYLASWLLMFFANTYHGPMAASVDDIVRDERSSLAQGVFICLMHLVGSASAPVLVGMLVPVFGISNALMMPTAALALAAAFFAFGCMTVGDDHERATV